MSENKKLNIKKDDTGPSKKLVLKKPNESKGLKIKGTSLPQLNETPDPDSTPPAGLTIKSSSQQTDKEQPASTPPSGLTIKSSSQQIDNEKPPSTPPAGLTIKSSSQQTDKEENGSTPPRGLTIKSSSQQTDKEENGSTPPRGLTIKSSSQQIDNEPPSSTPPRGLTIKANGGQTAQPMQQAPVPIQAPAPTPIQAAPPAPANGLTIKAAPPQGQVNPLRTPPPIQAPSFSAPVTSSKPPPPMPAGYTAPPPPKTMVNPQGPMFPTQGQHAQQPPTAFPSNQGEPAINPSGPVFPTQNQSPGGSGVRPPGTMPPPTHKRETSAPLSAIMGEVKAAKKINPEDIPGNQPAPSNEAEVVKVKKPAGVLKDSLGNEFCLIPKGTYYIGIENEQEDVKVSFTLGKYPVTKEQYFEFIKESGTTYTPEELNMINKISPYPNCPAVMVSWQDAKSYCRWLREKTGEYYALPSIKEWESAARTIDGRIYPWGDEEPNAEIACFNDGYLEPQSTCSVDFFMDNVSPFGCIGMIGNVMEWTLDSFEDERKPHILKGGSWMSPIDFCNNVTPCMSFPENKRKDFFGFRLLYLPKELYKQYRENINS